MTELHTLRAKWLQLSALLHRFSHWWWGELVGMAPMRLRRLAARGRSWLILDILGDRVVVSVLDADGCREVARVGAAEGALQGLVEGLRSSAGTLSLAVRLAPEMVLCRTLSLPSAAGANLRAILAHELERLTPFKTGQALFDFIGEASPADPTQLVVQVAVVPRRHYEAALAVAAQTGLAPIRMGIHLGDAALPRFNFLTSAVGRERRPQGEAIARWLGWALPGLVFVAAASLHLVHQDHLESGLRRELEEVRAQAQATEQIRREVSRLDERLSVIRARQRRATPLDVLAALSAAIPDDAWLSHFEMTGTELRISGTAPTAADLLGKLSGLPVLANPRFRAPVTRMPTGDSERFDISAELRP